MKRKKIINKHATPQAVLYRDELLDLHERENMTKDAIIFATVTSGIQLVTNVLTSTTSA